MDELEKPPTQKLSTLSFVPSFEPFAIPLILSSMAKYLEDNLQRILKTVLEAGNLAAFIAPCDSYDISWLL